MKISIQTTTFGKQNAAPLEVLRQMGVDFVMNPYGRKMSPEEIISLAQDVEGIIAGTESLTARVIAQLPKLKVISRCGVGMDNVDLPAAEKHGIKVYNTPSAPTLSVAELAVGMMLDLLRHITLSTLHMKAGRWEKPMGELLCGKKVGIIGFGRIGRAVAKLLSSFDVEIGFYDVKDLEPYGLSRAMGLEELLTWADIVTLHLSAGGSSKPLLGQREIGLLKKGAYLINTSRGGLVDEMALAGALRDGHVAAAALDVFEREPYDGPLRGFDQVVLTPHVGSYVSAARAAMEMEAVENVLRGLNVQLQGECV